MAQYEVRNVTTRLDMDNRVQFSADLVFVEDDGTETMAMQGFEQTTELRPAPAMQKELERELDAAAELHNFHERNDTLAELESLLAGWQWDPDAQGGP